MTEALDRVKKTYDMGNMRKSTEFHTTISSDDNAKQVDRDLGLARAIHIYLSMLCVKQLFDMVCK